MNCTIVFGWYYFHFIRIIFCTVTLHVNVGCLVSNPCFRLHYVHLKLGNTRGERGQELRTKWAWSFFRRSSTHWDYITQKAWPLRCIYSHVCGRVPIYSRFGFGFGRELLIGKCPKNSEVEVWWEVDQKLRPAGRAGGDAAAKVEPARTEKKKKYVTD